MLKKETHWLRCLRDQLLKRLEPLGWQVQLSPRSGPPEGDATLSLRPPDGQSGRVLLEYKDPLEPRMLPEIQRRAEERGRGPVLVGAPFLSPRTRELLAAAGLSYADLTGNLRLALRKPAIYVEAAGAQKSPWREPRPLKSLKGRAVARVIRALCDFSPPYSTSELAERSGASLPTTSRVLSLLDREKLLSKEGRGLVCEVTWPDLIREWTRDYAVLGSNETESCLAPRGLDALEEKLSGTKTRYAVTGSLAAQIPRSVAPARLAMIYADDSEAFAEELDLRPADKGANVILIEPFDPVAFERSSVRGGLVCAAFSQVAADLLTSPGRGPAEGEELLRWMQENESGWRS